MDTKKLMVVAGVVALMLAACGKAGSPSVKSPGETVRAFYLAANDGKYSEAEAMLAKEAKAAMNDTMAVIAGGFFKVICDENTKNGSISAVDIVSEHIRGEGATVAVNIRYKDGTVKNNDENDLILRDGKWQLTIGMPQNGGPQNGESTAIGNLRTITGTQTGYSAANGSYAPDFASLTSTAKGPAFLLGTWTENGEKDGYTFTLRGTKDGYIATANPTTPGVTGNRYFYTDESGVIRVNTHGPATEKDPPLGMELDSPQPQAATTVRPAPIVMKASQSMIQQANSQIGNFKTALMAYRLKFNRFPTTAEGLGALIENERGIKFLESNAVPKDPWNNDYVYTSDDSRGYSVSSRGADGLAGTADDVTVDSH